MYSRYYGINVHPVIVSSIRMCIDFMTGARSFSKDTMMFSLMYYYVLSKVYISLLSVNVAFKCYVKLSYHTQIKFCNCFIIFHFTNFSLCPDINPYKKYCNNMSLYNFPVAISDIFVKKYRCVQYDGVLFAWKAVH
jgi:hypothetical protein